MRTFKILLPGLALIIALIYFHGVSFAKSNNKWQRIYKADSPDDGASLRIIMAGDIMLGRSIAANCIKKNNFNYPFEKIKSSIVSDLFISNLESPLTGCAGRKSGPYMLKAPAGFASFLRFSRYTILSLANNHSLDAGPDGLKQCMDILNGNNIYPAGAGKNKTGSFAGIALNIKNVGLKIFAFNLIKDPEDYYDECQNYCRAWFSEESVEAIKKAKRSFDFVIVVMHWGEELEKDPGRDQITLAQKIIKAGADIIIGSHPHVLQRADIIEYKGKKRVILYSLGNFIFDQYKSSDTRKSALFRITLSKNKILSVDKLPVAIVSGRAMAID